MGMPNNGKIPVKIDVGLDTSKVIKQLEQIEAKIKKLDLNIKTDKSEESIKRISEQIGTLQTNINSLDASKISQALTPIQTMINGLGGKNGNDALNTLKNLTKALDKLTSKQSNQINGTLRRTASSLTKDYEKAINKVTSLKKQNLTQQTTAYTQQLKQALAEEAKLKAEYDKVYQSFGDHPRITKALEHRKAVLGDVTGTHELQQLQKDLIQLEKTEQEAAENAKRQAEEQYKAVQKISDAYKEVEKNASRYYQIQAKDASGYNLTTQERYFLNKNGNFFNSYQNKTGVFDESQYSSLPIDLQTRKKAALKVKEDAQISFASAELDKYFAHIEKLQAKVEDYSPNSPFSQLLQKKVVTDGVEGTALSNQAVQLRQDFERAFLAGTVSAEKFFKTLKQANQGLAKLDELANDSRQKLAGMWNVTNTQQNIESWIAQNTKYLNSHGDNIKELRAKASALNNKSSLADVDAVNTHFNNIVKDANESGQNGLSILSKMDKSFGYALGGTITALTTVNLAGKINEAVQASNKLNASMIELSKVSDSTMSSLDAQFDDFAKISKDIGGTIDDTLKATADWSRNGYSLPDSKELARVSQLYKNIGDNITIDEANTSLISTMQGYKMQASEAEHIVDILNEVSNNEATSSAGLGEALQRSAASFEVANTSLEKSVALITAANSVVQDPSRVGKHTLPTIKIAISVKEGSRSGQDRGKIYKYTKSVLIRQSRLFLLCLKGKNGETWCIF